MYSKESKTDYTLGLIFSYIYICTLLLTSYTNLKCTQQQLGTNLCGFYACHFMISLAESPAIYDSRKLAEVCLVSQSLSFTRTSNSGINIIHAFKRFTAALGYPKKNLLLVRTRICKWLYDFYIECMDIDFRRPMGVQ